ncbi:hypothetical protein RhiirC2_757532 [Rhizophagus irregularis]|uniref:Uncharacterized protein n=1 Tax=Rhizophagus irregularis TaxID=588596 RepID=A0A2N1MQL6_9GLOM|nr:hypothetical protein RhiirC2_757532 [Rhizophagus irregularis]
MQLTFITDYEHFCYLLKWETSDFNDYVEIGFERKLFPNIFDFKISHFAPTVSK